MQLARSFFLALQYQSHSNLHLALQALHNSHRVLIQHHIDAPPIVLSNHIYYFLHFLYFYLYIAKVGLSVGKPMGRHPYYINPKP
jgi:hypothetical protein